MGSQSKPVVLEGTLQSPKMLAVAYGENAQEMAVAVRALGSAIQNLQQQFNSAYGRVAVHMTTSNQPLKRADVKAALGLKDAQGRRRLMSSVIGASRLPSQECCKSQAFTQLCSSIVGYLISASTLQGTQLDMRAQELPVAWHHLCGSMLCLPYAQDKLWALRLPLLSLQRPRRQTGGTGWASWREPLRGSQPSFSWFLPLPAARCWQAWSSSKTRFCTAGLRQIDSLRRAGSVMGE